jgi:hypothetical protein
MRSCPVVPCIAFIQSHVFFLYFIFELANIRNIRDVIVIITSMHRVSGHAHPSISFPFLLLLPLFTPVLKAKYMSDVQLTVGHPQLLRPKYLVIPEPTFESVRYHT